MGSVHEVRLLRFNNYSFFSATECQFNCHTHEYVYQLNYALSQRKKYLIVKIFVWGYILIHVHVCVICTIHQCKKLYDTYLQV